MAQLIGSVKADERGAVWGQLEINGKDLIVLGETLSVLETRLAGVLLAEPVAAANSSMTPSAVPTAHERGGSVLAVMLAEQQAAVQMCSQRVRDLVTRLEV